MKIISKEDLRNHENTYRHFEDLLIKLVYEIFGYHSKFETGYGWLLNVSKLKENETISSDMFNKIHKWFEKDLVLGQEILAGEWKKYYEQELEIKAKLLSLLSEKSNIH